MIRLILIVLEVAGIIGLVYGFAKKNRTILLVSGILLLFGGPIHTFVRGLVFGSIPGLNSR